MKMKIEKTRQNQINMYVMSGTTLSRENQLRKRRAHWPTHTSYVTRSSKTIGQHREVKTKRNQNKTKQK